MNNEIKTWLYGILQSINETDGYYKDKPKVFDEYISDIKSKRAIERNIEIIGEAVNRILKKNKNFGLSNAEKPINLLNQFNETACKQNFPLPSVKILKKVMDPTSW